MFDPDSDPKLRGFTEGEPPSSMPATSPADILLGLERMPTPEERSKIQFMDYKVCQEPDAAVPGAKHLPGPRKGKDYLKTP